MRPLPVGPGPPACHDAKRALLPRKPLSLASAEERMHYPLNINGGNNSQAALGGHITFRRNTVSNMPLTTCKKEGLKEQPASSLLY